MQKNPPGNYFQSYYSRTQHCKNVPCKYVDILLPATDLMKPLLLNPGTAARLNLTALLDPYFQRLPFKF